MTCNLCNERIPEGRLSLGYVTCLVCGEAAAKKLAETRKSRAHLLTIKVRINILHLKILKLLGGSYGKKENI